MPVLETERRKNHIDKINPTHMLLPIAVDCLHYQENDRPSSEELCQRLAGLKESREYRESTSQIQDEVQSNSDQVLLLTQQLQEKDKQILEKDKIIQEMGDANNRQVQDEHKALQQKNNEIQERDRLLQQERQLQEEVTSQERQLQQSNQQLEEQEQVTAEIQQTNHSLQRQVEQLQQQLSQQSLKPPQPPPPSQAQVRGRQLQVDHKPHPHSIREMSLNWKDGGKAPLKIIRGAAVVDGDMAYFISCNGEVCSYNVPTKKWTKFPKCPNMCSSLAVINGQLTAIGGCKNPYKTNTHSNQLLSLPGYKEVFPAMPTKRRATTAVTSKKHLIVAGGIIGLSDRYKIVEVMDTKSLVWSTVASLPHPYTGASVTIYGDQLYMLGGADDKAWTKSVLTCSLTELLQSSSSSSSSSSSIWHRVADAPAYSSTCAAVNGELLAVGGRDEDDKPLSAIHKYNPTTNSWDLISNMPTARYLSLIAVLPTNEMMVVGGTIGTMTHDVLDIIDFSQS